MFSCDTVCKAYFDISETELSIYWVCHRSTLIFLIDSISIFGVNHTLHLQDSNVKRPTVVFAPKITSFVPNYTNFSIYYETYHMGREFIFHSDLT